LSSNWNTGGAPDGLSFTFTATSDEAQEGESGLDDHERLAHSVRRQCGAKLAGDQKSP